RYNVTLVHILTDLLDFARDPGLDTVGVVPAAEDRWTAMVDRNAVKPPSFGPSSYYFGANIPGKPRRYLLNSAGRPKLFSVIAEVKESDYKSFRLTRRGG